jgi:hypothetical protein
MESPFRLMPGREKGGEGGREGGREGGCRPRRKKRGTMGAREGGREIRTPHGFFEEALRLTEDEVLLQALD